MSALSNKLFIVVLAAVICTTVVAGSAVLPSLNAPLLVFALLFVTFPFPPVLLGVAEPLVIPRIVAIILLCYLCQLYYIIVIGCCRDRRWNDVFI